ncbi:copper chaperone PCu(A)C [bacterium]|nr:copper chaperone PCu(A)C [bacterium]
MKLTLIAALAALVAMPAFAHNGVHVIDPYARVIGPSGAAFFRIVNHETTEDTLLSASSPDAGMVMLMNDHADANGVMKMADVPEGFAIPAGDQRLLANAGDHVMLMNLPRKLKNGDKVTLILTFKNAGKVTVTVPIDNKRLTESGAGPTPYDAESAE